MRTELESLLSQLVIECDETFAVAVSCDNDEWTAIVYAVAAPKMPLFDRRGEQQLKGTGVSVAGAMAALEARCAIR